MPSDIRNPGPVRAHLSELSLFVPRFVLSVPSVLPFHALFFLFPFLLSPFSSSHFLIVPWKINKSWGDFLTSNRLSSTLRMLVVHFSVYLATRGARNFKCLKFSLQYKNHQVAVSKHCPEKQFMNRTAWLWFNQLNPQLYLYFRHVSSEL